MGLPICIRCRVLYNLGEIVRVGVRGEGVPATPTAQN
jgi:hypothetical protein